MARSNSSVEAGISQAMQSQASLGLPGTPHVPLRKCASPPSYPPARPWVMRTVLWGPKSVSPGIDAAHLKMCLAESALPT